MNLCVKEIGGKWALCDGGRAICYYPSSREAWKACDKLNGDPLSRREDIVEWLSRRNDE